MSNTDVDLEIHDSSKDGGKIDQLGTLVVSFNNCIKVLRVIEDYEETGGLSLKEVSTATFTTRSALGRPNFFSYRYGDMKQVIRGVTRISDTTFAVPIYTTGMSSTSFDSLQFDATVRVIFLNLSFEVVGILNSPQLYGDLNILSSPPCPIAYFPCSNTIMTPGQNNAIDQWRHDPTPTDSEYRLYNYTDKFLSQPPFEMREEERLRIRYGSPPVNNFKKYGKSMGGHSTPVSFIRRIGPFSHPLLVSGGEDGKVCVWDPYSSLCVRPERVIRIGYREVVREIEYCWSRDIVFLLSGSKMVLLDTKNLWKPAGEFLSKEKDGRCMLYLEKEQEVLVGTEGGMVNVWDMRKRKVRKKVKIAEGGVVQELVEFQRGEKRYWAAVWTKSSKKKNGGGGVGVWSVLGEEEEKERVAKLEFVEKEQEVSGVWNFCSSRYMEVKMILSDERERKDYALGVMEEGFEKEEKNGDGVRMTMLNGKITVMKWMIVV